MVNPDKMNQSKNDNSAKAPVETKWWGRPGRGSRIAQMETIVATPIASGNGIRATTYLKIKFYEYKSFGSQLG